MKKILFIHHWHSVGGSGVSLYNTWKSLVNDYSVVTYIPDTTLDLYDFLTSKGLKTKTYSFECGQLAYYSGGSNIYKPGFWRLIFQSIKQIPYWRDIIVKESPDIIMVNSKVLCWMAPLFKGIPSVCFVRETIKGSPYNPINTIMKIFLEKFTLVSFLSKYDLVQTNLFHAKSVVSPDILNPEEYCSKVSKSQACEMLGIESESFNIAFVGGIDRLKGIDVALNALSLLGHLNIKLVIAGNDIGNIKSNDKDGFIKKKLNARSRRFSKRIRAYINENNLSERVRFVGVLNDISLLYSATDVLIFPMKKPHQARPAFEIGMQKKPVIISNFENVSEFVINGVNGLVFEPSNFVELASKITQLVSDRTLTNNLGNRNYELTLKLHTAEYAFESFLKALNQL